MSSTVTIEARTGITHLPRLFELQRGGVLEAGHLAFDLFGPAGAPVVVVLGGISSGRRVTGPDGWWRELVGDGLAIDTTRVRVLGIDFIGSNGASTNASNLRPQKSLPAITPHDQARAIGALLDDLRVERLQAFVGSSYGGQVALAFAAEFPDRVDELCVLCAAHRSDPLATAWRGIQRDIVRLGRRHGDTESGLALARALAMTTYRSRGELERRFDGPPSGGRFPVEGYLAAQGAKFADAFTAEAFLSLSESLDLHRVDPAAIRVRTTLIGFSSDLLVPIELLRELRDSLAGSAELVEVETEFGHDGFLKETSAIDPVLRRVTEVAGGVR